MKAAVLTDDHRFDVADLADPTPGAGELVLRVGACGICGSDLKAYAASCTGAWASKKYSFKYSFDGLYLDLFSSN